MPPDESSSAHSRRPLPAGCRQGIITAITILLGFSLAFIRFWAFEAPGVWTLISVGVTAALVIAILMEIYTLYRSLRVADDDEQEYARTVHWFIASAVAMLVALLLTAFIAE